MKFSSEMKLLAQFNQTSLTDVILLLLIFFLLSSSFVVAPGIKVRIPRAVTGETGTEQSVVVTLTEQGQLFLNADRIPMEDLGPRLNLLLSKGRDRIVVVRADRNATLQSTIQIIDIAKAAGASRFMIATEPIVAP
jgi:biopolymer transport protein ExbD